MKTSRSDDWALLAALDLDIVRPGFAGGFLRASHERRQVITAYLACAEDCLGRAEVADFLSSADHRSILRATFTTLGQGMRRALSRSGNRTHPRRYYRDLNVALVEGSKHVRQAIMQSQALGPAKLALIQRLPEELCDVRLLVRLDECIFVDDLLGAIDAIVAGGVDRAAFMNALLTSTVEPVQVVQKWTLRLSFSPGPVIESSCFRPVRDGRELRQVALRYRNCSRRYVINCLSGQSAFGEYTAADGRQVLVLAEKRNGEWYLEGVYAARNRDVPTDLREEATAFAAENDVPSHRQTRPKNGPMAALRRVNRAVFDW
ncbi:hypothetical protein [Novosphingobium decolorationis]|uniref:WYL domain-containing protein n=1 Tax=Novosphingobium decolorationis TaxID=2698673 RepID=A0ABX8E7M6_9SPHN|nr:hypothetical protein [Novosphingobium decolorationis]QVM85186.1 hypothetical protein HT578_17120 [Novosphingobium decolorationis]